MKLSRRRKSARRVRHTKRAGKKLRYKSKKFSALKRYHRRGGRHTKKLYGRRVKKGGEVNFDKPTSSGEPSESNYTYTLTGTIKSELRYRKIKSVMSDTSPFDIEITASRIVKTENNTPVTINITFTRKKNPIVTYTMTSDELILILESISDPKVIKPQIIGVDKKNGDTATYEFSFKDNEADFKAIKNEVKHIQDSIGRGTTYRTGTKLDNEKRENEDKIEDMIKSDKVLKINIAPLGQNEDKEINYPAEIEKLQKQVNDFRKKHPDKSHDISRAKALMALIPDLLLGLLVGVYSNEPLKGSLNRSLNRPTTTKDIMHAKLFTSLTEELTSICDPVDSAAPAPVDSAAPAPVDSAAPAASPYDNDPVDSAAPAPVDDVNK